MFGSVADWPALYRQVYRHMKPGGWINQLEMSIQFKADDGSCPPDHTFALWSKVMIDAGEIFGKTFQIADKCESYIREAGFEEIVSYRWKLPVGGWSSDPKLKELGRWNYLHCETGAEGWGLFLLTRVLNVRD